MWCFNVCSLGEARLSITTACEAFHLTRKDKAMKFLQSNIDTTFHPLTWKSFTDLSMEFHSIQVSILLIAH